MKKIMLVLCLVTVAFVAARSTTLPVWDTCPGKEPIAYRGGIIVTACVHQERECPKAFDVPLNQTLDIQCWVWFAGSDAEAPHWWLADR